MSALIRILIEGAEDHDIEEDVKALKTIAEERGIPTPGFDANWHSRYQSTPADEAEDLVKDFQAAGYDIDLDDGPFMTVYEGDQLAAI